MPRKELLLLLTLALIQFTHIMDFMIIMPLGRQLMNIFQINPQEFGFIVSSYNITAGIMGFLGAFFIDNFDRKKMLIVCYLGFLVGTFACAFAPDYYFLLSSRILTGAFGGLLSTLILSIVGDAIPESRRATAMGFVTAGFSLASIFGVPFGNFLATQFNWHAPFLFVGFMGIIISVMAWYSIPFMNAHITSKSQRPTPLVIIANVSKNINQRRALMLMGMLMLGQFTIIPYIAAYMESNVGFSQVQVTYIYLFGGLCTVFSSPLIGRLADRIGKKKVFNIFALLATIPLFLITQMGVIPIWIVLIITSMFFVVVTGRMIPAISMITSTALPKNRGSFMSFNSSVQQLSAGLAAFIGGAIVVENASGQLENYDIVGYIAIVSSLAAIYAASKIYSVEQTFTTKEKPIPVEVEKELE
jgi:predicted MFS family arabinose efflux permease